MGLDAAGVPLRVRSRLARMRPERKAVLRRTWSSLRRRPDDTAIDPAVLRWLAERAAVRGRVLEVGPHGVVAALGGDAEVLDPWGRARAAYVGAVGDVLGDERFDAVVAPCLGDDEVTAPDPVSAVRRLLAALRPGGTLLAVVEGGAGGPVRPGDLEAAAPGAEVSAIEGTAAVGIRAVAP